MPSTFNNSYIDFHRKIGLDSRFRFMNHGYFPVDTRVVEEEPLFQTSASLYTKMMSLLDTKPQSLLEIGCGRGGGLNLIRKLYGIPKISGFDYNRQNVQVCNTLNPELHVYVDDADNPFHRNKYDVILNLESSHCYDSYLEFFKNVVNMLTPNGRFLYGDSFENFGTTNIWVPEKVLRMDFYKHLVDQFNIIEEIDITDNVAQSCKFMLDILPATDQDEGIKWYRNMYQRKYNGYSKREIIFNIFLCEAK